jgi:hypothetical protein
MVQYSGNNKEKNKMTSDYDDKPDWREIDRRKDKSNHTSSEQSEQKPSTEKSKWAQKMYMKEIQNLFKGKKGTKEHSAALEEIHQKAGTKKFNTVVKKYIKEYGLPDDWSTLFLFLDYKDMKIIIQSLSKLTEMVHDEPLTIKEGFKSKLSIIAMTTPHEDLREAAEEALSEL